MRLPTFWISRIEDELLNDTAVYQVKQKQSEKLYAAAISDGKGNTGSQQTARNRTDIRQKDTASGNHTEQGEIRHFEQEERR